MKPNTQARTITTLEVTDHTTPVQIGTPYSSIMLAQLNQGMMPTISALSDASITAGEQVKVVMSAVNFQQAYRDYVGCLSQLLPVNYKQIARSAAIFLIRMIPR
ncbi:MAG: hypothetical protein H7A03_06005 [Pseudomonadales bacterium]|nr:hypothetical protein [Pseudomonadales bacterium]